MEKKETMEDATKQAIATQGSSGVYNAWTTLQNAASVLWSYLPAWSSSASPPVVSQKYDSVIEVIRALEKQPWVSVQKWPQSVEKGEVRPFSHDKVKNIALDSEHFAEIAYYMLNAALFEINPKDIENEFDCLFSASLKSLLIVNNSKDVKRTEELWESLLKKVTELSTTLFSGWSQIEQKDFPRKIVNDPSLIVMRRASGVFDGEKIVLKKLVEKLQSEKLLIEEIKVYSFSDKNLYFTAKNKADLDTLLKWWRDPDLSQKSTLKA